MVRRIACTGFLGGGAERADMDIVLGVMASVVPAIALVSGGDPSWTIPAHIHHLKASEGDVLPLDYDLECPGGSLIEPEPCAPGETTTGNCGCNCLDSPNFTLLEPDEPICGSVWSTGAARDNDWYMMLLPPPDAQFRITVTSEVALFVGLAQTTIPGSGNCAQVAAFDPPMVVLPGETGTVLTGCVAPGAQLLVVRPLEFEPISCETSGTYVLTVERLPACGEVAPPPCAELGDLDGDGTVGFLDFLTVLSNFGGCLPQQCADLGDLDGSYAIDFADVLIVLSNWGPCPG